MKKHHQNNYFNISPHPQPSSPKVTQEAIALLKAFFHPSTLVDMLYQFTPASSPSIVLFCSLPGVYPPDIFMYTNEGCSLILTRIHKAMSDLSRKWSEAHLLKSRQQTSHRYQVTWKTKQPKRTRSLLLTDIYWFSEAFITQKHYLQHAFLQLLDTYLCPMR